MDNDSCGGVHCSKNPQRLFFLNMALILVFQKMIRYFHYVHKDKDDSDCMPIEEFTHESPKRPICWLGSDETTLRTEKQYLSDIDSEEKAFFLLRPSYSVARTEGHLLETYHRLDPKYQIMSTMVLVHLPCHSYFDIDAGDRDTKPFLKDPIKVAQALLKFYILAWEKTFQETPDTSQWVVFEACNTKKFSLHAHNPLTGFTHVENQRQFVVHGMMPLIMEAVRNNDPDASYLGSWEYVNSDHSEHDHDQFFPIIDQFIYTGNRVFRLPHNHKPGKENLRFLVGPDKLADNKDEQILCAQISYRIPETSKLKDLQAIGRVKPPKKFYLRTESSDQTYHTLRNLQLLDPTLPCVKKNKTIIIDNGPPLSPITYYPLSIERLSLGQFEIKHRMMILGSIWLQDIQECCQSLSFPSDRIIKAKSSTKVS